MYRNIDSLTGPLIYKPQSHIPGSEGRTEPDLSFKKVQIFVAVTFPDAAAFTKKNLRPFIIKLPRFSRTTPDKPRPRDRQLPE